MPNLKFSFAGQNVLITGASQGIGLAIAKAFLKAEANVTLADLRPPKELSDHPRAKYIRLDVGERESCAELAAQTENLNILINNAGITRDKSLSRMTDHEFDDVIAVNLTGVYNMTKALLPRFSNSGQNRVINMASVVALYGNFGQTNYAAAKAGVIAMSKTWAREFGRKGFTVNAIAPGFVQTPMTAAMPPEALSQTEARIPLGRLGTPEDIANTCLFLASSEASYINGAIVSVDGGLVI